MIKIAVLALALCTACKKKPAESTTSGSAGETTVPTTTLASDAAMTPDAAIDGGAETSDATTDSTTGMGSGSTMGSAMGSGAMGSGSSGSATR